MSQERTAFLKVRSLLEAHASFASTDIFYGRNKIPEATRSKAIIIEDGGRTQNEEVRKMGTNTKYFTTSVRIILLVRVLPGSDAAQTADLDGITDENTGILDLWADIENAIGAGTTWSDDASGTPSSYMIHNWTPVTPISTDEYPGWRGREAEVLIKLGETHT